MTESIYEVYTQQSSSISIPLTMEIHIGKEHYENFEYGICIFTGESQQILEMHLFTCEMFECAECDEKSKSFSEMKKCFIKLKLAKKTSLKFQRKHII